jgi:hypothetical protein
VRLRKYVVVAVTNSRPSLQRVSVQAGTHGVRPRFLTGRLNLSSSRCSVQESGATHRSLYRDVEATSVTPFASRAQDKALHAILVALVRQTVPGMDRRPMLNEIRRSDAERIAGIIEGRVARIDPAERIQVAQKLERLIDEWTSRPDLETYWDDYNRRISLLMSAEQFAATVGADADLDREGARRALWPTPNSMREVEPGAPFVLRQVLRTEDNAIRNLPCLMPFSLPMIWRQRANGARQERICLNQNRQRPLAEETKKANLVYDRQ